MKVGYARVSTLEQDLELQKYKLRGLGVDEKRIYVDHGFSGKKMTRDGLEKALAVCREGDELVVPSLDRLARNTAGTLEIMRELGEKGVVLNNGGTLYNPHDPMAKLFFTMLAAVAEAEGGWISIRTKEAMMRPNVRSRLKGKQPSLSPKQDAIIARHLEEGELTHVEIAELFKTSRTGLYRAVARHRQRQGGQVAEGTEQSASST